MEKKTSYTSEMTLLALVTDSETEAVLKEIPFKELGIAAKILRGNSKFAFNYLKKNDSPSLLIVDLSEAALPITEMEKISGVCEPSIHVIALGKDNDVSIFRQLLALGVSDYLVKPLNTSLVLNRLKDVLKKGTDVSETSGFSYSGHIISFLGVCGGVGTSMLTANCAISMAEDHNKHMSLVDFNLTSAPLAHALDIPINAGLIDLLKRSNQIDQTLLDKMIVPYGNRLDILSSETELLTPYNQCAAGMKIILSLLAQNYNYTLVDCSHGAPVSFKELVFKFSDTIVLVCDLTFSSVRETSRLIRYFQERASIEQNILILANKVGLYNEGEISQSDFEVAIDHPITFMTRFDRKIPLECLNNASPLIKESSQLSLEIKEFAAHLVGKPLEHKEKSFLKNLFTA